MLECVNSMKTSFKFLAAATIVLIYAACSKDEEPVLPTDFSGGCEAVDLGLSVKWASYNVGATEENEPGLYFAWGETSEKDNYDWSSDADYKWGVFDSTATPLEGMKKYTAKLVGGDGRTTLAAGDDPATVNWGTKWRTPTVEEIMELFDSEKCQWKIDGDRHGFFVTGLSTGNSIYLPAAGYFDGNKLKDIEKSGYYWSSSVNESETYKAYFFFFFPDGKIWNSDLRYYGQSVRAVTEY